MYTHSNLETRQTQVVDVLETTSLPVVAVDGGGGGPMVREIELAELRQRAGGLARELGQQYGFNGPEWRTHWSDMTQTALLAFLENSDQPLSYAYVCARTALKNYGWVHVRGLNGGWKSLVARDYTLVDTITSIDADDETGDDNLSWRLRQAHDWDMVPRPVEWAVLNREEGPPPEVADLFRDLLITLVGMSSERWYPEQMYRGALILALRLTGHLWEEVSAAVGDLEWDSLVKIYQEYRHDFLLPFAEMSLMGREVIRLRGEMRVQWFETLSEGWLKLAQRKIVVFPHGIYTITYRQDRRKPGKMVAALQKGRRVNGRICSRQVHLGPAGQLTKEKLWERSLELERKLTGFLAEATGNLGRINESRQVMFGVI
ncbi:MAG: hypothetical protein IPM39_27670 [Chloroflexi bacterium]|nr:hypothetical protein [Chloroflexota bacterium]